MLKHFILGFLLVWSFNGAVAAVPELADRTIQNVHPEEQVRPSAKHGCRGDLSALRAFEASVQRPVMENPYKSELIKYFVRHPTVGLFTVILLLVSLPIAIAYRHH